MRRTSRRRTKNGPKRMRESGSRRRSRPTIPASIPDRHPAPRAMANACSTAGRVWRARQTMTASPPVVRMARRERGQADRRCEVALDGGQQRRGGEPEEGNERQLVEQEPEEPTHETCRPPLADRQQRKERAPRNQRDGQQVSDRQDPSSRQVASPDPIRAMSRPPRSGTPFRRRVRSLGPFAGSTHKER